MGAKCQQRLALWPRWPHSVHKFRGMLEPAEASNMHDASAHTMHLLHLLYSLHLIVPWTPVLAELIQQAQNRHRHIYIHSHTHLAGISICCQLLHPDRRACLQYRRSWVFTDAPEYS